MNVVAVLSLTRNRLEYTKHCFASLRENAGCEFDHYVLDQGSQDGTVEWLREQENLIVTYLPQNIGISRGLNMLRDTMGDLRQYDVIVKVDNDCELLDRNTLRDVAALSLEHGWMLSPRVEGTGGVPIIAEHTYGAATFLEAEQIGGIFMAVPTCWYRHFRYNGSNPTWGKDDDQICRSFRRGGGHVGFVSRLTVNHFETTEGQEARYPEYFAQKVAEGMPWV